MQSKRIEERTVESWFNEVRGQQLKQRQRALDYWNKFLEPHNETWILENKSTEDWGQHLCDFRDYLSEQPLERGEGFLSSNTTKTLCGTIRGYLKHIGCIIKLDKRQKLHLSKVEELARFDFPFNIRIKEKLLSVADTIEEYIVSCGVSFGLRIGDFLSITRGQLEPLLNEEVPISIGKIQTEKVGEPAYPFISSDCQQAIQRRLREMDKLGKTNPKEPMLDLNEGQVNEALQDHFKKAEIGTGSYVVRFHILRKFLTDCLASVSSGDKWKRIVGKSAQSPYIADECREAYKRVLPLIDVNGNRIRGTDQTVKELRSTIADLQTELTHKSNVINALEERIKELETRQDRIELLIKKASGDLIT